MKPSQSKFLFDVAVGVAVATTAVGWALTAAAPAWAATAEAAPEAAAKPPAAAPAPVTSAATAPSAAAAPATTSASTTSPAARAALEQLLGASTEGEGGDAADPAGRVVTTVRAGETLDGIIRRTLGDLPFKESLLRAAFVAANPKAYPNGNIQRLPTGTLLNVPSAAELRQLLLRALGPERAAALRGAPGDAGSAGPGSAGAAPSARAGSAALLPPPPPRPDHRGWARFP